MDADQIRFEKNIIYTKAIAHEPDARGVGYVYFEYMSKNAKLRAQLDGPTGVEETYGELLERCIRAAIAMKKKGINCGDVVSLCTYNHLNSCVPHIASMFIGAKVATIDPSMSVDSASYLLQQVMPKLIFVQHDSVKLVENVIKKISSDTVIVVFGPTDTHIPFSDLIQPHAEELQFKPVKAHDIRDVAVIMFSSGTTGLPKGVCHTHYSLLRAGPPGQNRNNDWLVFASDSPYWNCFLIYLHKCILTGAGRLTHPEFDVNNPWMIFNYEVTEVVIDLTKMLALCNVEKPKNVNTSKLEIVTVSGSPVSEKQITKIRSLFPNSFVRINYGQTECFPNLSMFDGNNPTHVKLALKKKNSCGLPKNGISYKFVDESGQALGPNEKGELRVKTDMQLSGYYNMDSSGIWDSDGWLITGDYGYYDEDFCFYIIDRVKEMFEYRYWHMDSSGIWDSDGWLITGDYGYYDEDFCFYIIDRVKEMFEYRYWHIVPAVLEGILQTHPAVYRAVVVGIPHEVDNYHPMAVVQLKSSAQNVTAEQIEKYVEEIVEDRQRLRGGVQFVKSFPATPSGKVNRMKLKNMILQRDIQ